MASQNNAASAALTQRKKAVYARCIGDLPTSAMSAEKVEAMNPDDRDCIICLDPFAASDEIKFLPCFHRFHAACADSWLMNKPTCPVCKHSILPAAAVAEIKALTAATTQQNCVACAHCSERLLFTPALGDIVRCHRCRGLTQAMTQPPPPSVPARPGAGAGGGPNGAGGGVQSIVLCAHCHLRMTFDPSRGHIIRCSQCQQLTSTRPPGAGGGGSGGAAAAAAAPRR